MEKKTVQEWREMIRPALSSKCDEFKLIGYQEVTENELWSCLEEKIWKGNPRKRLYEVTADILHLSSSTYMNYIRVGALQVDKDDLMSSIQAVNKKK